MVCILINIVSLRQTIHHLTKVRYSQSTITRYVRTYVRPHYRQKSRFFNLSFTECFPECNNQSIEEYLNDLETLGVITETFAPGRAGQWKVVGGDVTNCLHADSKSDFKDYVTLSNDMMDAILLNG